MTLKTEIYILRLILSFLLLQYPLINYADAPSREPYDYRVYSTNRSFYAEVSVNKGIRIYKNSPRSKYNSFVAIHGWYPWVFLSNDGLTIVAIGATIVPVNDLNTPVFFVFNKGKLIKSYSGKQLIFDKNTEQTTSGIHWGDPIGFSSDDLYFSLKLDTGKIFNIPIFLKN